MIRDERKMRGLLLILALVGLLVVTGGLLAGCGDDDDPTATTAAEGTATTGDGTDTTAATAGDATRGGVARVGGHPATNLDPHFSTSIADIMLNHQIYDWLVEIDVNNQASPGIATSWDSSDGQTWTFEIREGVTFHDGSELTAEDVVYTFDRLRDESVGSPLVGLYSGITSIEAPSPTQVVFTLGAPNPEFPSDLGDYHAAILPSDNPDPKARQVGSGPFELESYSPEDRATLVKNESYWKEGDDGQPLPYLDGLEFIFSPDLSGQMEALRGGELDFVGGLSSALADTAKSDSNLQVLTVSSNMHYVIHMRSDEGPAADNRVRQALKLGTDHQSMIEAVRPGLADVGNGSTPVGPSYGDYYLDQAPERDVERAQELLAEAGFENGLDLTLTAQQALDIPDIATVWREQMAEIGVNVQIETVPSDVYYGEGGQSWLEVPFGITEWGARATPVTYFKLAYITGGDYNESHWSDPEMDDLIRQIDSELDRDTRIDLYHQAQELMIERGPVIVPFFESGVAGASASLQGVQLATDWARTLFTSAYLEQ